MVANAGICKTQAIQDSTDLPVLQHILRHLTLSIIVVEEDWDQVMSVNLRGVMLSFKYSARQMIKQGKGGCIIGTAAGVLSL